MFCRPPTSPRLLVGHRRHRDGAELRRERADAEPGEQHRPRHDLRPRAGIERGHQDDDAGEQREETRTARRAAATRREELGHADGREQQRDRQRQQAHAGRDRREPERDRQEQRHHEEQPGLQEVLEEERREPAPELRVASIAGSTSGSRSPATSRRSPTRGTPRRRAPPASMSQIAGDSPSHSGAPAWAARTPTSPERRMPNTTSPSPSADSTVPTRSRRAPLARRARRPCGASSSEDADHDDDFTGEDPPPREVRREQAADQRTGRDRDRAGRGDEAVGARALRRARSSTRPGRRSPA